MTGSAIALQKAVMIPVGDDDSPQFADAIAVQFNPESLKVTQSNTLETANAGNDQSNAAQFVDKSESSLAVQLIFDTSIGRQEESITFDAGPRGQSGNARDSRTIKASHEANSDVRKLTKAIAEKFMKPREASGNRLKAPQKCRFQWGTFAFTGMMASYDETLDFFAPEGVPLRATLALTFKEDRFQFENLPGGVGDRAKPPGFTPGGDDVPVAKAAGAAGLKPTDWRKLAMFNGSETPRVAGASGLSVPGDLLPDGLAPGGSPAGRAESLGAGLPGAFTDTRRSLASLEAASGRFATAGAMAAGEADAGRSELTAAFDDDTA